ncbi:hypothetical protein BC827DRAFT_116068 [Russula dissimulans]|nr:hypothetical protein BC827DRAFT_116068 [Russula dissimulans]
MTLRFRTASRPAVENVPTETRREKAVNMTIWRLVWWWWNYDICTPKRSNPTVTVEQPCLVSVSSPEESFFFALSSALFGTPAFRSLM